MNDPPVKLAFEYLKPMGETVSWGALIGALIGWLPSIATLLTIIWYGMLFYDRARTRKRDRSQDGTHY